MKKLLSFVTVLMLDGILLQAAATELPDFVTLAKKCEPAVVNISTRQSKDLSGLNDFGIPNLPDDGPLRELFRQFFGDRGPGLEPRDLPDEMLQSRSLGSGFFVSSDGYILTNYHVVNKADEIIVRTSDRREYKAKVVGSDRRSDTALIKVNIQNAPVVEIGSSKDLQVGAWVLAIGSPFGFDHSVTQGIVSALGRSLPSENYVPFIQTDVAINPGNSGGPLLDLQGKVVGINSQIYSRTGGFMGLSFAVPIDLATNVMHQLKTHGHVSRGWLGVMIQDVDRDLAETFGMSNPRGALVVKVLKDSPAAVAKINVGDVILEYNGQELATSADLPPLVGMSPLDINSTLRILRGGKERDIQVMVGKLPDEDEDAKKVGSVPKNVAPPNRIGLVLRDLTTEEQKDLGSQNNEGVMVERVTNGVAKEAGFIEWDIILMFDGSLVQNAADLQKRIDETPKGRLVAVLVARANSRLFLSIRLP